MLFFKENQMVAFTGNGLVRTQRAKSATTQNRNRQINDRLVEVVSYDVANATMRAKEKIKQDGEEKYILLDIKISPEAIERNNESAKAKGLTNTSKFKGHLIDDKMARDVKVGGLAVIERSEIVGKVNKDQEEVFQLEAQRIINVPNPEPEKTFTGIFTLSSWDNKINFVQHWNERALSGDNKEELQSIANLMDDTVANYGKKEGPVGKERLVVRPSVGVQLRAVVPFSDENNPKTKYQVIDTSGPLDFIPAKKDDAGEVVTPGHPLDSENFYQYLEGYTEHVRENFPDQDVRVEVCPYFNYSASNQSATLTLKDSAYDPLTQMATAKTRLSQDEDSEWVGKNWAVKGIVQISGDAVIVEGKQVTVVDAFYVNKLHANNIKGHIHSWVNSSDGGKTVPHPMLQRIKENTQQHSAAAQKPVQQPVEQSVEMDDPFGDKPASVKP